MLTVRTSERDKEKKIRRQQTRDDRLRAARREDIQAHETAMLGTREAGQDRRTQATGEFGLEGQRLATQGALQTGAQRAKASMAERQLAEQGLGARQQAGILGSTAAAEQANRFGIAGRTQAAGIASTAAEQANRYQAEAFSRNLGGQAYLGGQDPSAASQITAAGPFPVDYAGLKPFTKAVPKSYQRVAPQYDKSLVPQLLEPGGVFEKTTGAMDYDTSDSTVRAMIKKLEDERARKQGLGR